MYKFIIVDTTGMTVYTSITNCKSASLAQRLGFKHLKSKNYSISAQVRVIPSNF